MFGIGPLELVLLLMILLVVFGAKRLPEMGRSLGTGMREFKEGITESSASEPPSEADKTSTPPVARSAHD